MEKILQCGIWKNRLPFHFTACPGLLQVACNQDAFGGRPNVMNSTLTRCFLQILKSRSVDNELSGNLTSPRRFISRNNTLLVLFSSVPSTSAGFTAVFTG